MADNYIELCRKLSRSMEAESQKVGILGHPTAKGDGREDAVCGFLRDRVGTTFGVSKAEVIDSRGCTTGEYDCAIYDQSIAASLHVEDKRRVVRVEALAMTVEVKSELRSEHADELWGNNKGLIQLTRFYKPTPLLSIVLRVLPQDKRDEAATMFRDGLHPFMRHQDVPAIVSGFFAFDGPEVNTAAQYMSHPGVDFICVLNKYTIAKGNLGTSLNMGRPILYGEGIDALGAFLHVTEMILQNFRASRTFVWPDTARYYGALRRVGADDENKEE